MVYEQYAMCLRFFVEASGDANVMHFLLCFCPCDGATFFEYRAHELGMRIIMHIFFLIWGNPGGECFAESLFCLFVSVASIRKLQTQCDVFVQSKK